MGWKISQIKNISVYTRNFLCVMLIIFSTSFLFFPNHVNLNKNNKINFNLPINKLSKYNKLDYIAVNNNITSNDIEIKQNKLDKNNNLCVKNNHHNSFKNTKVVPIGTTIGVCINTDGIMVLGTGYINGEDGKTYKPCEGILESGDLIIKANEKNLNSKEELLKIIEESENNVNLILKRNNNIIETNIKPIKSSEDKVNRIGIWVRDSTQGIGTLTYYNPETNKFGALGHSILDVDTKKIISINNGSIMGSEISYVKKGEKGAPGELIGTIQEDNIIGSIKSNTKFGLYGYIKNNKNININNKEGIQIGLQSEVHEGPAKILSNVEGSTVKEYDIFIESVNKFNSDDSKGMVIKIIDKELLAKTNGIVQGMSGSPIIQSGKLIGAVTHVFIQDPTKGYGIFIENMLNQDKNI